MLSVADKYKTIEVVWIVFNSKFYVLNSSKVLSLRKFNFSKYGTFTNLLREARNLEIFLWNLSIFKNWK
jgi:hypothetical protein